jgi:hypothetical protein
MSAFGGKADIIHANRTSRTPHYSILSVGNPVDFYRTAFELLCASGPGASGAAASGVFAASAPLVTPFVASCAPLVTPFVASCAPLMTPLHPARLGLGI